MRRAPDPRGDPLPAAGGGADRAGGVKKLNVKQKRKGRNPSFFAWEERTTPPSRHGRDSSPYILRTETPLRDVPVLRMAYFPSKPHRGFDSKTRMLQPRSGLRRGSQKQPLRRCGVSSPYTGEPRKRRNLSLPLCARRVSEANLEVVRFGEKDESFFGK